MASLQRIVLEVPETTAQFLSYCSLANDAALPSLVQLRNYLDAVIAGTKSANLSIVTDAVKATATITSTGTAANNETMTLCNQTITAKTSGAVAADGQFNISATPATQAASIAAAINAMSSLVGKVSATSSEGVVTVTSLVPGLVGNALQIVDVNLANVAVAAFSGGADGTTITIDKD